MVSAPTRGVRQWRLARLPVMVVMLVLLAVGLEALLALSAGVPVASIIGAAYLLWMAWQAIHVVVTTRIDLEVRKTLLLMARSEARLLYNPKLILIFFAFFPFIDPETGRAAGCRWVAH